MNFPFVVAVPATLLVLLLVLRFMLLDLPELDNLDEDDPRRDEPLPPNVLEPLNPDDEEPLTLLEPLLLDELEPLVPEDEGRMKPDRDLDDDDDGDDADDDDEDDDKLALFLRLKKLFRRLLKGLNEGFNLVTLLGLISVEIDLLETSIDEDDVWLVSTFVVIEIVSWKVDDPLTIRLVGCRICAYDPSMYVPITCVS